MNYKLLIAIFLYAILSASCFADTFYVDTNSPADFNSIQSAINDANDGDVIIVNPGRYIEHINTLGKAITLQSTNPDDPQIIANTIIDGNDSGTCITFDSDETENTIIAGFLITDGNSIKGGGMYCNNSNPTIKNCTFANNKAKQGGGIYCIECSNIQITDCFFNFNEAVTTYGGYDGGGAIYCDNSSLQITNCSFNVNSASGKDYSSWPCCCSGYGGAVFLNDSTSDFLFCAFNGNYAFHDGGALYASYYNIHPVFNKCIFNNNTARQDGGAISGVISKIENSVFNNNQALGILDSLQMGDCGSGGAISGTVYEITKCSFSGNTAEYHGGAIFGFILEMANTVFTGNKASRGGAMGGFPLQMTNCILTANRAGFGGGVYNNYGSDDFNATAVNCTFNSNVANQGSVFYVDENSSQTITDCTFHRNVSLGEIGGGFFINPYYLRGVIATPDHSSTVILGDSLLCSNSPNLIAKYNAYTDNGGNTITDICPDPQPLKGDIDFDGCVDVNDLQQLANDWLTNN